MKIDIEKDIGLQLTTPSNKAISMIILVTTSLVLGLAGLALYKNPGSSNHAPEEEIVTENAELQFLQQEVEQLKKELIALSRERSIQQATNKALNRKLFRVEDELTETRKKQLLFNDILASDDLKKGLHIRHFDMRKKPDYPTRRYHYTVVLSQTKGGKKIIQGQYIIRISGTLEGKPLSYTHRELAADGIEAERKFSLKYYQSLEGDIVFPENFEPTKVTLWIIPKNKNLKTQRKAYQWAPLVANK